MILKPIILIIMSRNHSRTKTMGNLSDLCTRSFTQQLVKKASAGFPSSVRQRIRTELIKAEDQARSSHTKLISAKTRKLDIESSQEHKRKQLQQELLTKQDRSEKNLEKLRLSQRSSFEMNNKKLDEVHSRFHKKQKEQMATFITEFNKTQQQMVSFYTNKQQQKQQSYDNIQQIQKKSTMKTSQIQTHSKNNSFDRSYIDHLSRSPIAPKPKSIFGHAKLKVGVIKPVQTRVDIVRKYEQEKQAKILTSFMEKMEEIANIRVIDSIMKNKRVSKLNSSNPKKAVIQSLPQIMTKIRVTRNPQQQSYTRKSRTHEFRFSEQYAKRLQQKRNYLDWSLQKRLSQGEEFMRLQSNISQRNRVTKAINETKNEVKRRIHYELMEQIKNAK